MQEKTELKLVLWFTISYLVIFTILITINKNYEFINFIDYFKIDDFGLVKII